MNGRADPIVPMIMFGALTVFGVFKTGHSLLAGSLSVTSLIFLALFAILFVWFTRLWLRQRSNARLQ